MRNWVILFSIVNFGLFVSARADLTIIQRVDGAGQNGDVTVKIKGDKERIDAPTREWYEAQHRLLVAAGADPLGPSDLRDWAARHPDLHPSHVVLGKLDARFETRYLEWRPYLYRWLGDPATEELERGLIDAGAIRALGFRYAGRVRK